MAKRHKAAELTTKKRDKLDESDFAFPKQRKEPLSDAEHVRQALARFDQVEDVSDAEKAEAKKRILKAAKKYGIQVDAGDDVKAASQPSVSQVHVNAPLKKVSVAYTHDEDEDDAKKAGAAYTDDDCDGDKKMRAAEDESDDDQDGDGIPDDEDPADQADDDDDATPKGKKVDSTAGDDQDEGEQAKASEERPTRAFLTKMREHLSGKVSAADLDAAIRHARAHAGGKGKAEKRAQRTAGEEVSDLCAQGADYRLFLELRQAAEAPDWIPFLPTPGTYTHPQWGKIAVTRDRSQQFIDNFHAKVYQEHIPLDAEHQTKLSGAFAYLRDLRMNEDGSVDAQVEWTDRGKALVEADRFKYFSPEWFDSWTAPDTGKEHHNVIIGGAFTTRPFFKDASLRPLVASERGLEVVDGDDVAARYTADAPAPAGRKDNGMPKPTEQPAQASEQRTGAEEQNRDDAASKRFAELEAKFAASEQARQANEAALKQATEVIAGMQADARRKRFTEEVMGRGEQSGARWYGEPDKNVKLMERLADALGEDSKEFRSFVEQQRAVGEALRQSSLFSELGSDASADADSPEAQLDALAKKYHKQHSELTFEQAYSRALTEHPEIQRRLVRR